jgi:Transposase and inactivated derivatives
MCAEPHRLVFIDGEAEKRSIPWTDFPANAVKTNMTRLRGRAARGDQLDAAAPSGHWRARTLIADLTTEAIVAPWIIDGAMNGEAFAIYVETQFAPALEPGTVVVLDNLAVHRNARAARALRERGCWFLFPPPDSPDPCVATNGPPDRLLYAPHPSRWPSPS